MTKIDESREFQREFRYIVFKLSDLGNSIKGDEIRKLSDEYAAHRAEKGKAPLACVVIESDWPEYETVWQMIEDRVTGRSARDGHGAAVGVQPFEVTDDIVKFLMKYGGYCRDCAEDGPVCPMNGVGCGQGEKAVRWFLRALNYGLQHKFIEPIQPSAAEKSYLRPADWSMGSYIMGAANTSPGEIHRQAPSAAEKSEPAAYLYTIRGGHVHQTVQFASMFDDDNCWRDRTDGTYELLSVTPLFEHEAPRGADADLLAALKLAKTWLEGWASAENELEIINAAIAKHEGGGDENS